MVPLLGEREHLVPVVPGAVGDVPSALAVQQHLPLVIPFKYLGVDEATLNKLDAVLQPMVDSGYSRNDNPATAPITVDPVNGYDPAEVTAPATQATFGDQVATDPISQMLALFGTFGSTDSNGTAPPPLAAEAPG